MNREDFKMLEDEIVYFDNGATTLKPKVVKDAVVSYYDLYTSNIHRGDYKLSVMVDEMYDNVRKKVCDFIGAKEVSEIVFTSGTTDSLNMIVNGYFRKHLKKDDEVLITVSEHASNILPWFKLQNDIGIKVKYIELDNDYKVTIDNVKKEISDKTKVISLAHITNVVGDVRPIKEISRLAHDNNILMVVDAAQSVGHNSIDVVDMDIDFMAFSAHKMYGPTGVGVMYGKFDLLNDMDVVRYGGGMNAVFTKDGYVELREVPTRFEAGTPNVEGVLGMGAGIDYINSVGINKINEYEHQLKKYLLERLNEVDNVEVYNKNSEGSIVAFHIKNLFAQDTAVYLDKYNICVRAGNHCAKILNEALKVNNTCRIVLSFYNTKEEIDLLINVLKNSKNIWKEIL